MVLLAIILYNSFIPDISVATLQVHYYLEAPPTIAIDTVSEFMEGKMV